MPATPDHSKSQGDTPLNAPTWKLSNESDAALKRAIKVAAAAGQYERAMKLLEVLRATTPIVDAVERDERHDR